MAKWFGKIGYVITKETKPGVWTEDVTEKTYRGDVLRNTFMFQNQPNSTNDNLNINRQISIVADQFINDNLGFIRYAEYMGSKWKVTSAEPQYPRIILTLGGVYNG